MPPSTIAAIASPPGASRRGVLRLSGPRCAEIVRWTCAGEVGGLELAQRGVYRSTFSDGSGLQPALILWMPAPRSFTREDVVELHLSGNPDLLQCALRQVLRLGAEPAEPGEFTRRAFQNGRIDLSRAEGVLALVAAHTQAELRAASALVAGSLEKRVRALREQFEQLRALCEASLDFDEQDTGHVPQAELLALAAALLAELEQAWNWEVAREAPLGLPQVVLRGKPNVGKSSLFNALLGRDEALVSAHAGTTRDVLRQRLEVAGLACALVDTAGLEQSDQALEQRAQELGRVAAASSDLELWVLDALAEEAGALSRLPPPAAPRIILWNKIDQLGAHPLPSARGLGTELVLAVSAKSQAGFPELRQAIADALGRVSASGGIGRELSLAYQAALSSARAEFEQAYIGLKQAWPLDWVAESLRRANQALDRIHGRTTPEDLLERIFARFCLGK